MKTPTVIPFLLLLPSLLLAQEPATDFNPVIDPKLYQHVVREAAFELSEGRAFSDAY